MTRLLLTIQYATKLNEHQSRALYSICTSTHAKIPYILKGPPGTGKTRLIAKTIEHLLQMDKSVRVLVTAHSNMAADMIAHKIMEEFSEVMHASNVLRLRSCGNDYYGRDKSLDPICRL
jgi:superfamily II DNA or RNA helicase